MQVFYASNAFYGKFGTIKKLLFPLPRFMLPSVSDLVAKMLAKSLSNSIQNILEVIIVFRFMPVLYRDYENFGKNTSIFCEIFIKTVIILTVRKKKGGGEILHVSFT